ncbi:MAG: toll/interleukin-1 receptor domain-containing protein [Anaerolineae bacterium]|nr:toll/interleukin-1 receptor domain-containing protein [Anaerolineae bacterium]
MAHVFISYSRTDFSHADELRQTLETHQFEVWMDTEIPSGSRWQDVILSQIETCSAMVVVVSPRSAHSFWVMREISYAHEFKKPIFPYVVEGPVWPPIDIFQSSKDAHELLKGLRQVARLFISYGATEDDFAGRLAADLADLGADLAHQHEVLTEQERLASSQIMLLVVSPETMYSSDIKTEWLAFHTSGKPIIPLLLRQTGVPTAIREKQPYIDFVTQDYQIAFAQLYGVLRGLGVNLAEHEQVSVPPQSQLQLDGYEMFAEAQEEVWISGITLDVFARRPEVITKAVALNPQLRIKFMLIQLDVEVINAAGTWIGINEKKFADLQLSDGFKAWQEQHPGLKREGIWVGARLYRSLEILTEVQKAAPDSIKIRTVPYRLGTGYFIVDPKRYEGMLTAYPYFYQLDPAKEEHPDRYNTSPVFLSRSTSKENELWWFDQYVQEFNDLWDDGEDFDWANP